MTMKIIKPILTNYNRILRKLPLDRISQGIIFHYPLNTGRTGLSLLGKKNPKPIQYDFLLQLF